MTNAAVKAIREIAEKNAMYNEETKTLEIKTGRMAGKYTNLTKNAAIEIVRVN